MPPARGMMERSEHANPDLIERLRRLEERVDRLERGDAPPVPGAERTAPAPMETAEREGVVENVVPLIGRTLLILGGAYLLRAMTDSEVIPAGVGVAIGLAWGAAWLFAANRVARTESRLSAAMYVLAAVLIGHPVLVEAVWRFGVLSPLSGAMLLSLFTAFGLWIAWRRSLYAAAWLVSLGAIGAAILMALATRKLEPFAVFLILFGLAMLWLSYVRDWFIIRWIPALVADLGVAVVTVLAVRPSTDLGLTPALLIQMLLLAGYLGSFAVRTIALGRVVLPFEIAQSAVALLLGIGGAVWVTADAPALHLLLGAAIALLSVAGYAVAFAFIDRHPDKVRNFLFYSSVALALAIAGTLLLLSGVALALTWAGLGLIAAVLADRYTKRTLAAHSAVFIACATFAAGSALAAIQALFYPPSAPWLPLSWEDGTILAIAALSFWTIGAGNEAVARRARAARLVLLAAIVVLGAGAVMHILVGDLADAGTCAAWRTVVLSSAAVLLALTGTRPRGAEAAMLVSPLLIVIGVKLAIEDLRVGRPITLFVAFAVYGGALVLAPRLRKAARRQVEAAEQKPTLG